mmetsp:Transcript_11360/g.16534  ORF Transcript_11360/g.16534 Transcript_11360/m.16534 type:complete len:156 (+) Transcript_11360:872-1339(+)
MDFIEKNKLHENSHTAEWFYAFLPKKKLKMNAEVSLQFLIEEWCTFTNLKAVLGNAGDGGCKYNNFEPFTVCEIQKILGVYILNGLSPSPQVEHKLKPQSKDPINGINLFSTSLGKFGTSARCFKEFKCFFSVQDPRYATPSRKMHPNWKVERFL